MQVAPPDSVRRDLKLLKAWAVVSMIALALLLPQAFDPPGSMSVDRLEVGRIDIVGESGLPALSIAGQGRLPGPTFDGTEYPQDLSGGRTTASGMIFFNERGDEVGGLTYQGDSTETGYGAYGGITFDQFRQDQVVSLRYVDDGASRSAGMDVWDRSTEVGLDGLLPLLLARRDATGARRDSVQAELDELVGGGIGAHRVFLGSRDGSALLVLRDRQGQSRVRLLVDSLDVPRLEFLDASGDVVHIVPGA